MLDMAFHLLILTRVTAAVLFGFGLGLERELTNKYAGLRTHILVCLGSCVFTILSIYAFPAAVYGSHGDPARISAQILTGIGFIGGGTVLRHGSSVYGLTTAATLWVAASIGMACGVGMLSIAFITTLVSVSVLVLIRAFERDVLVNNIKNMKQMKITVICSEEKSEKIYNYIMEKFDYIHEISKKKDPENKSMTRIIAIIDVRGHKQIQSLNEKLQKMDGLDSISIQEHND